MNRIIILPVLVPFATALIMLLFPRRIAAHRLLGVLSTLLLSVVSAILLNSVLSGGILSLQAGGWAAPFGITMVVDTLSCIMLTMSSLIGLTTAIYSIGSVDEKQEHNFYHPLIQLLLMGINGAFLTGDIFNLYVWFEVMLISSFVLLVLEGKPEQFEGAIKYVTLNLLSSAIFLAAVGILYGMAGTLNMADLAMRLPLLEHRELLSVVAVLFLITFGIKAAVFPLFFWLPASYHTPHIAVSAIFAGLLTKVGVYAIIRFFTTIFTLESTPLIHQILLWVSAFTMATGVLGAVAQYDLRKLLSFHIISQIGYMIFAVAIQSPLAIAGGLLYIVHNIVAKTNLFYLSGIIRLISGSWNLRQIGGLYATYPLFGLLFLVPALALAGIPPLSGFWAKLTVIRAGLEAQEWLAVGVALLVSMLTLYSMIKIWNEAFLKDDHRGEDTGNRGQEYHALSSGKKIALIAPVVILGMLTILSGIWFEPLFVLADRASLELLDASIYSKAVTGGMP